MWGSQAYILTHSLKRRHLRVDRIDRRPQTAIGADHAISRM